MDREMSDKEFSKFLSNLLYPINSKPLELSNVSLKNLFDSRLAELKISQNQVEKFLSIERKSLDGILDKTAKRVDVLNLLKLGSFLSLTSDDLLQIYLNEMPVDSIRELEQAKKASFIVHNFDLNNLYKVHFLSSKNDFEYIENRLNRFFKLDNIFDYSEGMVFPMFSRTKKHSNNLMRDFWVKSAITHFDGIDNPFEYDRAALVELIPKIRPYTMNVEKGLLTVCQALFNVGVTVIYQPYLPTVQVRGATFLYKGKPCVVITDLNKNYPTIWFALIHELHHVLYDLDAIERNVYHITGEPDLLLVNEEKSNEFAREYLFSYEKSRYIAPFINDELLVQDYARQNQVHESFIYNFHNYDQSIKGDTQAWSKHKQYFPDVKLAVKNLNTSPWTKETISESVEVIKKTVFSII